VSQVCFLFSSLDKADRFALKRRESLLEKEAAFVFLEILKVHINDTAILKEALHSLWSLLNPMKGTTFSIFSISPLRAFNSVFQSRSSLENREIKRRQRERMRHQVLNSLINRGFLRKLAEILKLHREDENTGHFASLEIESIREFALLITNEMGRESEIREERIDQAGLRQLLA
ncbi:MAG: hypothetical protein AAGM67_00420, partial [Bacteroidota bacterium]